MRNLFQQISLEVLSREMFKESRPEKALLIIEVPEDRVFTDICEMGYLSSTRSMVPLMCKQPPCRTHNLVSPQ
jgi:hypothetical protein